MTFQTKMTEDQIFDSLKSTYGTEFTTADVKGFCALNDISYQTVTKKIKNYKVGKGKWNLEVTTKVVEDIERSFNSPSIERESLVPEKDDTFIRFGNFNDIKSILKSKIFYPPFGRQSSIAIQFIKRITACKKTKSLAFILPKSFKKDSMKRYFPLNYHLEHEEDVDKDGFTMDGTNIDVPCVFQIWIKKDHEREKPVKLEPKGYKFTKKLQGRYALRRVGVRAGLILDMFLHPLSEISEQSHYFIKLDEGDEKFIGKYEETINFEHNNTVGPKSISKQEFIRVLNELF